LEFVLSSLVVASDE
jgi:hypothetical protein